MRQKKKKERILKIHIAVDIKKTKKILLSMEITDEYVHDSKMLPNLVDRVNTNGDKIDKLLADGAYDDNDIFRYLSDNGIVPSIKERIQE